MTRHSDRKRRQRSSRRTYKHGRPPGHYRRAVRVLKIRPNADPRLGRVFATIGIPEQAPFKPDPFQLAALDAIEQADCLVTAPTGAGKTWIAEQAIARQIERGGKSWYASPLKALSNSKHAEFGLTFGPDRVGILTGDRKENTSAPIIVGTTEILRNQLYDAMHWGEDLDTDLVILDEAHFMGDPERGVVWEEIMIYVPARVSLLMLSATIGNAHEIADWLSRIRNKQCIVVEETERPVDLYPLFLHPSGTVQPLLAPGKGRSTLDKKVRSYIEKPNPPLLSRPRELPPFGDILRVMKKYDLLPAIFFLKSRSDCNRALEMCRTDQLLPEDRVSQLHRRTEALIADHPHLRQHQQLWHLDNLAVGAHHGGQLPAWKLLLETLMTEGQLDAVFATSTVAAGVNFPARSVVFFHSDRFNGRQFVQLTPTEFHQMVGRAGRRGMDNMGFALVVPGPTMDLRAIARLVPSAPSDVPSQVHMSFSMALNLLLSHTPSEIERLFELSFAAYRHQSRHTYLVRELKRHLEFLRQQGYVQEDGTLSESGAWATKLRIDQPLLIAECLRRRVLPSSDARLLAAITASFVYDRETEDTLAPGDLPRRLEQTFVSIQRALRPFATRSRKAGFETRQLYIRPAAAMYAWASGQSWRRTIAISQIADGDMAMLVSRTADNLRHVQTLRSTFPQIARTADQAIRMIMKEPVTQDQQQLVGDQEDLQ